MGSIAKEPLSSLDLLAAKGVLERLPTFGNWLLVGVSIILPRLTSFPFFSVSYTSKADIGMTFYRRSSTTFA